MTASRPVPFTLAGVRHGALRGSALSPGVLVYGIVFGVLAGEAGRSALEAVLMSAFIHSGSAQIAALQGMATGPYVAPIVATILLTNARYVLYGAALRPWYPGQPPAGIYPSLFLLGDGNWAMAMREHGEGRHDACSHARHRSRFHDHHRCSSHRRTRRRSQRRKSRYSR